MRLLLPTLALFLFGIIATDAQKTIKDRNTKEIYHKKHMDDIEAKLEKLKLREAQLEEELLEEEDNYDNDDEYDDEEDVDDLLIDETKSDTRLLRNIYNDNTNEPYNPCENVFCSAGRECVVSEDGTGVCECVQICGVPVEERRRVCSNLNETWLSDCELYKQRCLCAEGKPGCRNEAYEHAHIDYYGACTKIEDCKKGELDDFPRRMTEWLFSVMRDMADRQILSDHYLKLEKEAEEDESKRWTYAVLWKWCELDGHPRDKSISRHELFPLRAPLYTLEHCIAPFLDGCDVNNDHFITFKEWAKCLKLDESNLDNMEDMCENIRGE